MTEICHKGSFLMGTIIYLMWSRTTFYFSYRISLHINVMESVTQMCIYSGLTGTMLSSALSKNTTHGNKRWANDNGWVCWQHVIVGLLTLTQHWSNTTDSTVEVLLLANGWLYNYGPTVDSELWD